MAPNVYGGSPYFVEAFSINGRWRRHSATWVEGFPTYAKALWWAQGRIRARRTTRRLRIVTQGMVCWIEPENYREHRVTVYAELEDNQPQEAQGMATITEPLNIPRETLIGRLQEVADEARGKREKAQADITAARQALLDAIGKLTPDQIANAFDYFGVTSGEPLKLVESWVEEKKFVSQELEPTFAETVVERTIRVLNLADDKAIKVQPNDEIYAYL